MEGVKKHHVVVLQFQLSVMILRVGVLILKNIVFHVTIQHHVVLEHSLMGVKHVLQHVVRDIASLNPWDIRVVGQDAAQYRQLAVDRTIVVPVQHQELLVM